MFNASVESRYGKKTQKTSGPGDGERKLLGREKWAQEPGEE